VSDKKISRNDPCPCGSGKKFKNCGRGGSSSDDEYVGRVNSGDAAGSIACCGKNTRVNLRAFVRLR
jgi:hypothetical protein